MRLETIALETECGTGRPATGLLNWKLNDVLLSSSSRAAVILPSAHSDDHALLEFLAEWTVRFAKADKQLYIVPEGGKEPGQSGSALKYAASVAELKAVEPPSHGSVCGTLAPAGTMAVGALVTVSAEYVCRACGKSRMWLKGDIAAACDNLVCSHAQAGWRMTFELF